MPLTGLWRKHIQIILRLKEGGCLTITTEAPRIIKIMVVVIICIKTSRLTAVLTPGGGRAPAGLWALSAGRGRSWSRPAASGSARRHCTARSPTVSSYTHGRRSAVSLRCAFSFHPRPGWCFSLELDPNYRFRSLRCVSPPDCWKRPFPAETRPEFSEGCFGIPRFFSDSSVRFHRFPPSVAKTVEEKTASRCSAAMALVSIRMLDNIDMRSKRFRSAARPTLQSRSKPNPRTAASAPTPEARRA